VAGAKRLLAPTAKIGFHAAYDTRTGIEKGQGNAVVGAYLNSLGFGLEAILYATQAGPQGMTWLSQDDADRLGITYQWSMPQRRSSRSRSCADLLGHDRNNQLQ
jgi:hypothetical protein